MSRKNRDKAAAQAAPPVSSFRPYFALLIAVSTLWGFFVCHRFYTNKGQTFPLLAILNLLLPSDPSPFDILPTFSALGSYALGLLWALAMFVAALVIGRFITRRFLTDGAALESVVLSAALGYGVLAYVTLAVGLAGGLYSTGMRLGVATLALAGGAYLVRFDAALVPGGWSDLKATFKGGLGVFLSILLMFVFATDFVMAFVPELFYDALVYHLGTPNFYLNEHRIVPIDLLTAKFPFTVQMLHVIGLGLKDESVTKLTHLFLLMTSAGGMLALARRLNRPLVGLLAAVAFCSIPTVQMNVVTSGVDLGVSCFGFLAVYCFVVAFETPAPDGRWMVFSALFSGLTVASKYTAAYVPTVIFLTAAMVLWRRRHPVGSIIKMLLVYGLIVVAVMVPWLAKNFAETGNPVYPFLSTLFGGEALEPWRYLILKGENQGLSMKSIPEFFTVFWRLSIEERSSLSFQGPLFLACLPFVALGLWKDRPSWLNRVILYSALFVIIGLFITRLTRYLLPGIAVLAFLIGAGLERVLADKGWIRKAAVLSVFILSFFYQITWAYMIMQGSYEPRKVLLGQEAREEYRGRYHSGMNPNPPNKMFVYMEKNLPPDAKVLLVGEEKAYPLKARHYYSGVYDRGPLYRAGAAAKTPEDVARQLIEGGFTHIMVNVAELHRLAGYGIIAWTWPQFDIVSDFWDRYLALEHVENLDLGNGYSAPLVLVKILSQPRTNERSIDNALASAYVRFRKDRPDFQPEGSPPSAAKP